MGLSFGLFNTTMGQAPNQIRESIPQMPVEDFFRNPDKTSYQISPNGEFYSYLAPHESRKNIYVQHIQTGEARRITSQTDRDIAGYYWANDEKIEKFKQELKSALNSEGIPYSDRFYFLGYNAPYEFFNRKNEVIVELQ